MPAMSSSAGTVPDWMSALVAAGPLDEIVLLDHTWQGTPVWDDDATQWVATDAPELIMGCPPWPGLAVRAVVPDGAVVTVTLADRVVRPGMREVFRSELIVGDHGLWLAAGDEGVGVPVPSGNYPVAVWVDGATPEATRNVCLVLGPWSERRLGGERASRAPGAAAP